MIYEPLAQDLSFYVEYSDDERWKSISGVGHFHQSYEIYYLLENELIYHINNKVYHVKPGTVIIIPPNTIHTTRSINEATRKRILINLPTGFIEAFLKDDPELLTKLHIPPFSIEKYKRKKIEGLFYSLLEEYDKPTKKNVLIKSLLGQLLVELGEITQGNFESNTNDYNNTTTHRMLNIVDYINEHYNEKITLTTLSKIFYLNPSYISRVFKEKLNLSFCEYLRTIRIKEVCRLLEDSSLKLEEIAEMTGFNDSSDLCRTFKAVMHTSPSKFKANYPPY